MENNNPNKLQEQDAPLKNHDDAFVQVGKNGEPVVPHVDNDRKEPEQDDRVTTLDKR